MIQKFGINQDPPCTKCAKAFGVFETCRISALGSAMHHGACGCCIWKSKAMECSLALDRKYS